MARKKAAETLEASLEKLEAIVSELEKGEIPLEESLKKFEEGLTLGKHCKKILDDAELRVKKLVETVDGGIAEEEFTDEP